MATHVCPICGVLGAACGPRTQVVPVDAVVTGYKVIGGKVVPDLVSIEPMNMNSDEKEEFRIVTEAYERRKLRNQVMEGEFGHTSLVYVRCHDGVTRKMTQEEADAYMKLNHDTEIVASGTREIPKDDVIGASKATTGLMFGEDGRQRADTQPMTTRAYLATDRTRADVMTPAIGAGGAEENNPSGATAPATTGARRVRVPREREEDKE